MTQGAQKNEVFDDYAAFFNALLPQANGFMFHDRNGHLFWHDNSPDTSQLDEKFHSTLRKVLKQGNIPGDKSRIEMRDGAAYLIRLDSDNGHPLGVLTALASREMSGMPYDFCYELLQPALRSLSRELNLRVHLLDATTRLTDHGGEHNFLKMLGDKARSNDSCEDSIRSVLNLTVKHLVLDGCVLIAPHRGLHISVGEDPVDSTEAELMLDNLRDIVDANKDDVLAALANRPQPDPRDRARSWPILEEGKNLVGVLILTRPMNMAKLSDHSTSLASFVVSTVEHIMECGYDSLTGLISWPGFETTLANACEKNPDDHTLMYMDIDQLDVINDTFSRETGDEIMRGLAAIIRSALPKQTITRVTSDSFAALLSGIDMQTAQKLGVQICAQLSEITYGDGTHKLRPSVSIGISPLLPSKDGVHSLLIPAQVACQTAKERGRGRCELYQSSDVSIVRRIDELNLVGSIRNAIEGGKLVLYAQPIVKINGESRFKHYELLVRMLDANGVSMEPSDFLGTAERYQLMQELDRWVVSRAIEALVEMRDDVGGQPLSFSVNLSGQSLGNDQFLDFVRGAISRSGVTPDRLCFEITETVAVENLQKAQLFMEELKKMGCQFSLDDFGTGLSSFAYLKMFKVDVIKIDGRFIEDVIESEVSRSMVTAITEIARVMEVETVAEYVSSEAVLEAVRDLGVDWAQGYFVGEPIRMRDIVEDDTVMLKDATNLLEFESAVHTKESS